MTYNIVVTKETSSAGWLALFIFFFLLYTVCTENVNDVAVIRQATVLDRIDLCVLICFINTLSQSIFFLKGKETSAPNCLG